jgi:hypothetical protein
VKKNVTDGSFDAMFREVFAALSKYGCGETHLLGCSAKLSRFHARGAKESPAS